jgi:hypothetical protein
MRSKTATWIGGGLAILGGLGLAAAAILVWVVVPASKQLPADTNTTRAFSGQANVLLNPGALTSGDLSRILLTNVPVTAQRVVKVTATDGDTAQVVDNRSLTAQGSQVGGTEVTYAVNRKSLEAAPAPSGWTVTPHEGLTVSWPIGAERHDYTAWVNETQTTTNAKYVREEAKGGVQTYVYEVNAPAAPIKDQQVLGALPQNIPVPLLSGLANSLPIPDALKAQLAQVLPSLGDAVQLNYTYEVTSTIWIEPTTGIVVDTNRHEIRKAAVGPNGNALLSVPVYDVTTGYTEGAVTDAAGDAKDGKGVIDVFGTILPWFLVIAGAVLLIVGVVLLVYGLRRPRGVTASTP